MDLREWAKREIDIACKRERANCTEDFEWDYGCACYESAFKAFNSLLEDEHSGCSIMLTKNILNRLIDGKCLTPIEDTPDIWNAGPIMHHKKGYTSYQCSRMTSLFKDVYDDGTIKYHDVGSCRCVYLDNPTSAWYNGFIADIIHEKYPITMPYYPPSKPYTVYCSEGLSDPKNGDFDTIAIWHVIKPDGEKDIIERFFKESETGWEEITREEYEERANN